jgi:hypothetical protein
MKILAEFLVGVVYLAIVYSLVRPGSPAAATIKVISTTLVDIVGSATGYNQIGAITP